MNLYYLALVYVVTAIVITLSLKRGNAWQKFVIRKLGKLKIVKGPGGRHDRGHRQCNYRYLMQCYLKEKMLSLHLISRFKHKLRCCHSEIFCAAKR
ncbi:hypothetical protein BI364_08960 [Acidihalobacter yilgarnensis]|uniref:Uncharacterized protein n=1 Tax=Acidihalobacter yilgarnensis TaxID=2819280 RepID=A0A1D8INR7_9GAMM|nr:hypothetical protein [Acidihalobacter yilgarnensis]AOU98074.1 hypothetical protein BI364_08960 [Acidihalobacter yilgarnensis]